MNTPHENHFTGGNDLDLKNLRPRIALIAILCFFGATSVKCQTVTPCKGGASPAVSLTIVATATPPPHIGLRIAISRVGAENENQELQYKLTRSGDSVEFSGLCPGDYLLVIRGSDTSDCGYRTSRKIHVREKEKQEVRLRVRWKKGDICE